MHSERVHAGESPDRGSAYRSDESPGRREATTPAGPEGKDRGSHTFGARAVSTLQHLDALQN